MEISSYIFANMSLQTISNPVAIDYDPINGVIIWTDVGLHRIFSASLTGNNQFTIRTLSTLAVPDGIAVDALSRLLFYTDTGNDIIAALSFDGSIQKTIINSSLYEPRAIVTDPITGTIFWTDWGNMSMIEKANYDGTNRQQLITTGLVWPNGLAVDIQAGVIFWCDAGTEKIERVNVDGSQRQVIFQAQQPAHFFGITLYQYYLYYTDWEQRSVMRIRTNGSEQSSVGPSVFGRLNGIRAQTNGTGIQGINGCSNGRGGCSHLCFPQPGGSKQCACPDGMTLQADGQTCKPNNPPDNFLLITELGNRIIYRMDMDTYSFATIPVRNIMNPVAIDYDPTEGIIYWTDVGLRQIFSASIYGHSQKTVLSLNSVAVPDGIAVDAISRLLFYTDTGNEIIAVLSLDGSIRRTVINSSLDEPRAIVVDQFNGTIFWTDWGNISKIEKANYDGSNRQELINTGLVWPNGLAIDITAGVMYWCDGGTAKIERANVDGSNRQIILQAQQGTHFFGIALYQTYIYFTGWTQNVVMRISTSGTGLVYVGAVLSFRLSSMHVHKNVYSPSGINGCSNGNGGCSQFCFPQPGGSRLCACSDGVTLQSDGQTCGQYVNACLTSPCEHGGVCLNSNGNYSCNCSSGWKGKNCSEDVNECLNSPCANGGVCLNSIGNYSCNCSSGWRGQNCSEDVNECLNSPCANGGVCLNSIGNYSCNCSSGWRGHNCSEDVNECLNFPCANGGVCLNSIGNYSCNCSSGWRGQNCSADVNECLTYPCEHGGVCFNAIGDYSCNCTSGWRGKNCSEDVNICTVRNGTYMCNCPIGLTGRNCSEGHIFAYGEEVGDSVMLAKDDVCGEPLTILPMPIFGRKYNTLYVCSNGLVSFQSKYANPNPSLDIKSYLGYSFLAPYYTDLESNTNATKGNIFYQLYDVIRDKRLMNNSNVLYVQRILDELEGEKEFNATVVFIATWYRISPYPANKRGDESVSFQLVLTSDGTNTFVLYRYFPGEMKLRRNDVLIGYHFSTGEFKVHLNSFKMEALDIDQNTDTNGVVGLLLYRLTAVGSSLSNFDLQCLEWYESNKPYQLEYERKSNEMPACPCNSRFIGPDPWLDSSQQLAVSAINTSCLIAAPCNKFQPHGKICCFDTTTGEWLSYAPRAGGFLKFHPITQKKKFESEDVQMKKICCEQSDYCYLYYALRPVGECYSKFPYNSALFWGDPHIETLDAKQYTFNGWGEFTLLSVTTENTSFILQGRTDKATTNEGMAVEATSFTAFAARYNNESSIHVEMNAERNGTYVYGNGIDYSLDFANMTKAFFVSTDTLTLSRSSDTNSLNVLFSSTADPVALIISVGAEMLALGITLPPIFKNKTRGLLGNYDGKPSNDFVYPNGTRLAENATEREIFYYGLSWSIQDSESVFKYPNEKGHADFHHGNFTPKYLVEATESELREASLKCGNNTACVYDLIMTNSALVAEHTKEVAEQALKEKEETANTNPSIESNTTSTLYVTMYQTINLKFHASDDGPVTFLFQSNTVEAEFTYSDTNMAEANVTIYKEDQCELSVTAKDTQGYYAPAINFDFILCDGCSGHGSCDYHFVQTNDKPCSLKKAKCVCDPYWEGTSCQLDFDGCRGRPCSLDRNCSDVEASIHNTSGVAFRCSPCPEGYLENGYKCQDIDECNSSLKMCNQICTNTLGSFICQCENGYKLGIDQRTCEDIDECEEGEDDCDQNCTNDVGHYTCGCFDGFEYNVTLKTCVHTEIQNVCETSSLNCSQTAGCSSFNRTAKCFCGKGLQLTSEGTTCEDIDECISNPCSQNCSNFNGGFSCHCYQGYTLEKDKRTCVECKYPKYGKDCTETCQCGKHGLECNHIKGCMCDYGWRGRNCDNDIDECFEKPDRCGNSYEVCENFPGSFACRCKSGFERSDDGKCQDIDECSNPELNKCSQLCINNPGGFTCNCQRGFVIHPNNSFECIDVNECDIGTSGCEQICENVPGQFNCYCHYGYRLNSDRRTCVKERNICALLGNVTCSHICLAENKKLKCECENGYTLNADNRTCKDINECLPSINKCSQPHNCVNLDGSFSCLCDEGYWLDNDGITCQECDGFHFGRNCMNECNCGIGMEKCDKREGCICKSGWKGSQCDIDINECKETNIPCSGRKNVCLNTPGSHICLCEDGYIRDNSSADCMDLNECNDPTLNDCDQICINTDGSYMCSCNKGFALQGGRCIDIDECGKNNTCQHVCENTPGGYRCLCHVGFKVDVGNITQCKPRIECHQNETTFCESKGAQCTVSNGVALCQCGRGLQWSSETNVCIDIKDCDSRARCSQICKEEIGGYSCECSDGFLLREDTYTCTECYNNTYGSWCNQTCQCIVENAANARQTCNHINGTCICKPGWQGRCDRDIDECKLNPLTCSKIPNTACLNTIGSYECACLRDHILQNASCVLDNKTKLPPTNNGESAVPMTITLNVNVADSLNLDVMVTYQYLSNAASSTLETFYRKRMGNNLVRIVITSLARGSLIVAYSIYVRNAPEVVVNLTMTNVELASNASLSFENSSVSVDNVTVNGIKVPLHPSEDDLCRLYQNSFVGCSNGYECKVMSGIPSCREIPVYPIVVPIAIAVPIGVLTIIAIIVIVCLIRHRQRKAKNDFEDIDRHQYSSMGSILETETSSKSSVETRSKSPSLGRDMRNMHPGLSVSSKYSFEEDTSDSNVGETWQAAAASMNQGYKFHIKRPKVEEHPDQIGMSHIA